MGFQCAFARIDHHRDDLLQVEALFLGLAGLLDEDQMNDEQSQRVANDAYFARLKQEYNYLRTKFSLSCMRASQLEILASSTSKFPSSAHRSVGKFVSSAPNWVEIDARKQGHCL